MNVLTVVFATWVLAVCVASPVLQERGSATQELDTNEASGETSEEGEEIFLEVVRTSVKSAISHYDHSKPSLVQLYPVIHQCHIKHDCAKSEHLPRDQLKIYKKYENATSIDDNSIRQLLKDFQLGLRQIVDAFDKVSKEDRDVRRKTMLKQYQKKVRHVHWEVKRELTRKHSLPRHIPLLYSINMKNYNNTDIMTIGIDVIHTSHKFLINWLHILTDVLKKSRTHGTKSKT